MPRTQSIEITPEILSLIAGIDEFKGSWRALGTLAPERLYALRRVATIESIGSSIRIKGSRLSDREVERLLSNVAVGRFETRDEQEVAGYAEAMELVHDSWQSISPTETRVGRLHAVLLRHATKDERQGRVCRRDAHLERQAGTQLQLGRPDHALVGESAPSCNALVDPERPNADRIRIERTTPSAFNARVGTERAGRRTSGATPARVRTRDRRCTTVSPDRVPSPPPA